MFEPLSPLCAHHELAPELHTERLDLRAPTLGDFDELAAVWADHEVTRFIGGRPLSGEDVWAKILRNIGHWAAVGYGYWSMVERSTGLFVGEVGFGDFRRVLEPPMGRDPESGWVLGSRAHGRGLATEAVTAILAWGDAHLGAARTVCLIDNGNAKAVRVAEKCGYAEYRTASYKGQPVQLFERAARPS